MRSKKYSWIWLSLVLVLLFSACGSRSGLKSVDMTDTEKEFLCSIYTSNLLQEQIHKGKLLDSQVAMLGQIRTLPVWLQEKYPSHTFEVVSVDVPVEVKTGLEYGFTVDGGAYVYTAEIDNVDSLDFRENYYQTLIAQDCDAVMAEKLTAFSLPVVAAHVDFLDLAGQTVTERTTASSLLDMYEIHRRTTVFLQGDEKDVAVCRAVVEELGMFGGYIIYASDAFESGMTVEECLKYRQEHAEQVISDSFLFGYAAEKDVADMTLDPVETDAPEVADANRAIVAEALGAEDTDRSVQSVLSALQTIGAGKISLAETGTDNQDKFLTVTAEDGTVYRVYLTGSNSVDAVENRVTGEWSITSVK